MEVVLTEVCMRMGLCWSDSVWEGPPSGFGNCALEDDIGVRTSMAIRLNRYVVLVNDPRVHANIGQSTKLCELRCTAVPTSSIE